MDDINSYYQLLGLESGASLEEVKKAYRDSIKIWADRRLSPDPQIRSEAQEKIKEINTAYEKVKAYLLQPYQQNLVAEDSSKIPSSSNKIFNILKICVYVGVLIMCLSIAYYYSIHKPKQERFYKEQQAIEFKEKEQREKEELLQREKEEKNRKIAAKYLLLKCMENANKAYHDRWESHCQNLKLGSNCLLPLSVVDSYNKDHQGQIDECYRLYNVISQK